MRKVWEIIVVEGRYDAAAVRRAVEASVVETAGFGVFADRDKVKLIRRLAAERGVVLLTDSDPAGQVIRSHLKGMLPGAEVKQAYIPPMPGRERRKRAPSRAGLLGVEAMTPEVIVEALEKAGATFCGGGTAARSAGLTKADFYALGLSGRPESAARRRALAARLDLPQTLTANGLLEVVNLLCTREELLALL